MTNHLTAIASRQRRSRSRDLLFAGLVALAAVISITTVSTACHAAAPAAHVAHR